MKVPEAFGSEKHRRRLPICRSSLQRSPAQAPRRLSSPPTSGARSEHNQLLHDHRSPCIPRFHHVTGQMCATYFWRRASTNDDEVPYNNIWTASNLRFIRIRVPYPSRYYAHQTEEKHGENTNEDTDNGKRDTGSPVGRTLRAQLKGRSIMNIERRGCLR
jgi:hypothetical protein